MIEPTPPTPTLGTTCSTPTPTPTPTLTPTPPNLGPSWSSPTPRVVRFGAARGGRSGPSPPPFLLMGDDGNEIVRASSRSLDRCKYPPGRLPPPLASEAVEAVFWSSRLRTVEGAIRADDLIRRLADERRERARGRFAESEAEAESESRRQREEERDANEGRGGGGRRRAGGGGGGPRRRRGWDAAVVVPVDAAPGAIDSWRVMAAILGEGGGGGGAPPVGGIPSELARRPPTPKSSSESHRRREEGGGGSFRGRPRRRRRQRPVDSREVRPASRVPPPLPGRGGLWTRERLYPPRRPILQSSSGRFREGRTTSRGNELAATDSATLLRGRAGQGGEGGARERRRLQFRNISLGERRLS